MDTKSRKFDRLIIIRLVCVLLAVVFAFIGSVNAVDLWIYLEHNDAYRAAATTVSDFFAGNGEERRKSEKYNEYEAFLSKALNKSLFYSSGNSKGYENYKKKNLEKYCDDLIDVLYKNADFGTDYFVFYSLDKGYISLNKIGNFPLTVDSTFYYRNTAGYRIFGKDPDACNYKFESDDFTYDYEDNETTTYAATAPATQDKTENKGFTDGLYVSDSHSYYDYSDAWHEREWDARFVLSSGGAKYHPDIVSDNMKAVKSSKADAVVVIESAYSGDKYYSGTYEITLNRDVIAESGYEDFVNDTGVYDDRYDEYLEAYDSINDSLSKYKNAYFAVLDESTNIFTTNVTSKDEKVTPKNVEKLIRGICKNNSYVFFSGKNEDWTNDFERSVCNIGTSFENRVSADTVFTVWAGFDESLSGGIDPFSHTENPGEIKDLLGDTVPPVTICFLGWLICIIALAFLSGRRSYDCELHMRRSDRIFTLLRTAVNFGFIFLAVVWAGSLLFSAYTYYSYEKNAYVTVHDTVRPWTRVAAIVLCTAALFILADWILYITRHIKNRSLIKNISFVMLTVYLLKKRKERIAETERRGAEYKDFRKRILRVLIPVVSVIDIILLIVLLCLSDIDDAFILLVFPIGIAEYFLLRWFMKYITAVRDIFSSIHKMRMGENLSELEKEKMPLSLKAYAEDINSVNDGLKIAVENATREQRTKAELITNVSHDLKTPLTSIITYVDLLSKRDIEDEEAKKYIAVLSEKSEKLKKLINDLVEASKASSGNIPVTLVKMSLNEFAAQTVGEYEDDFSQRGLSVFTEEKEKDIFVTADSKLSFRVADNLMTNIKKYALPGTRVYIRLYRDGDFGCMEINNISEKQLNISADELKERFVRGDESRSSDGSGLGLSIAEDFMLLQKGKLDISINGDMFTAVVKFKAAE